MAPSRPGPACCMRAFFILVAPRAPVLERPHDHHRRGLHGGRHRPRCHLARLRGLPGQPPAGPAVAGRPAGRAGQTPPVAQQRALPRGAGHRGGGHGRPGGGGAAQEEGLFDARGHSAGQGRGGPGGRFGRQHRRADGDCPLRAQDAGRHRPPGHCQPVAQRPRWRYHRAGPRRQRGLLARAPAAVCRHGVGPGGGHFGQVRAHGGVAQCG